MAPPLRCRMRYLAQLDEPAVAGMAGGGASPEPEEGRGGRGSCAGTLLEAPGSTQPLQGAAPAEAPSPAEAPPPAFSLKDQMESEVRPCIEKGIDTAGSEDGGGALALWCKPHGSECDHWHVSSIKDQMESEVRKVCMYGKVMETSHELSPDSRHGSGALAV